jgi:hypothetical protein
LDPLSVEKSLLNVNELFIKAPVHSTYEKLVARF